MGMSHLQPQQSEGAQWPPLQLSAQKKVGKPEQDGVIDLVFTTVPVNKNVNCLVKYALVEHHANDGQCKVRACFYVWQSAIKPQGFPSRVKFRASYLLLDAEHTRQDLLECIMCIMCSTCILRMHHVCYIKYM